MTVLFLDQPECQEAGTAGGKGASLARRASLGVAVPGSQWVPARDFDSPRYIRWHQDRCVADPMLATGLERIDAVAAEVAES